MEGVIALMLHESQTVKVTKIEMLKDKYLDRSPRRNISSHGYIGPIWAVVLVASVCSYAGLVLCVPDSPEVQS